MSTAEAQAGNLPWWLEPGVEECEFCLQAVHYELLYFCSECDRPTCPSCSVIVRERRIVLCAECGTTGEVG